MTVLLLIRHGETDYVAKGIMSARMPGVPLNDKGRQQAAAVADALASAPIKYIYSSPMERALETAAFLAERLKLEIQLANGVIETDIGEWTGLGAKDVQHTELWQILLTRPSQVQFPGGESFAGIQKRAVAELKAIAERHPDDVVACFSHADIIRLAVAYFLDMPLDSLQKISIAPCSVTFVKILNGAISVPKLNLVAGPLWQG